MKCFSFHSSIYAGCCAKDARRDFKSSPPKVARACGFLATKPFLNTSAIHCSVAWIAWIVGKWPTLTNYCLVEYGIQAAKLYSVAVFSLNSLLEIRCKIVGRSFQSSIPLINSKVCTPNPSSFYCSQQVVRKVFLQPSANTLLTRRNFILTKAT